MVGKADSEATLGDTRLQMHISTASLGARLSVSATPNRLQSLQMHRSLYGPRCYQIVQDHENLGNQSLAQAAAQSQTQF